MALKLKAILDEVIRMLNSESPSPILLEIDEAVLKGHCPECLLTEGRWQDAKIKGYSYRVDPTNPNIPQLRHVHVAHTKHITARNKQVSWNDDSSRHDRQSFDTNFQGIEKAKQIARTALGLPKDFKLEHVTSLAGKILLLEDTDNIPSTAIILKG